MSNEEIIVVKEIELTQEEVTYLKQMIEKEKRVDWFWSTLRVWAGWIAATIVFFYTVWDLIKTGAKHIVDIGN